MSARKRSVCASSQSLSVAPPVAVAFGPRATSKIQNMHFDRLAIVYVRQSSPQQVLENRESRERQYALAQFAQRLGWSAERVLVIDEDQGTSGKTAENRSGFQRLMAEVSLNHVGIVLGLELSRLSRCNKDWHQLVDVCGIFNTLLCDQDGVYDSTDGNDRLLLGMKGAMSEFELVTLRNRLARGTRNKAERGELFSSVPLGYLKQATGEVVQEPDEQARGMVQLAFEKFAELGSAYAVFRYFTVNNLRLGFRRLRGERIGELEWRPASAARVLGILRHPIYAGAYAYGLHRAGKKNPVTGRTEGGKWFVPPDELPVLIQGQVTRLHFLGSIPGEPRATEAEPRTEGIAGCRSGARHCCRASSCAASAATTWQRRYPGDKKPSYQCHEFYLKTLGELPDPCGRIAAATLDDLVAREVLRALEPAALELSMHAIENAEQERQRLHDQWRQRLERARQEVARAERQYQLAEPENRLVVRTLEARWEEALKKQRQEQEAYDRFLAKLPATLSDTDRRRIAALSQDVTRLWHAGGTSAIDRKQIIRCLVERVVLVADRSTEMNEVTIVWQGGMETKHQIARPVGSFEQLKDYRRLTKRIRELHGAGHHLAKIAETLNREGFSPPRRRGSLYGVRHRGLLRRLGLFGELFQDELLEANEWWIPDLARKLKVISVKIHYWVKQGWINHRRTPSGKHLIVWADQGELRRLRKLAGKKTSWFAARHPELVVPKQRSAR